MSNKPAVERCRCWLWRQHVTEICPTVDKPCHARRSATAPASCNQRGCHCPTPYNVTHHMYTANGILYADQTNWTQCEFEIGTSVNAIIHFNKISHYHHCRHQQRSNGLGLAQSINISQAVPGQTEPIQQSVLDTKYPNYVSRDLWQTGRPAHHAKHTILLMLSVSEYVGT